jgi:large subunit ribosomal protein L29
MKVKEIREKETSHLEHEMADQQKHLFELRSQAVTEKLEDPSQIGKTRKTIARMKTVLRQREIEEASKKETKEAPKKESKKASKKVSKKVSKKSSKK